MEVLIPFRYENPKARLSLFLSERERKELALAMLLDVIDAIPAGITVILCDDGVEFCKLPVKLPKVKIERDPRGLDDAVNDRLRPDTAVIVSDLPLLNREVVRKFFETEGDVVIAPGRRGGTNMLLVRKPFRVSYHYGSFQKHLSIARAMGLKVTVFDSFFAGSDVDTPEDLLEVLLHRPESRTGRYLRSLGFRVLLEKNPRLVRVRT